MKKVFFRPLALFTLAALTLLACSSKYPGYDKTQNGLYYKLYKVSKDTAKPKTGDWVSLDMKYMFKDSVLFNSKSQMGQAVRFQLPASDFKGDIYEGIRMMSPGDSAAFIINADSLFKKTFKMPKRPAKIDSNGVINFYVHLLTVDNPVTLMKKEQDLLQEYITKNSITVQPTPSGIYFMEQAAGKGIKIDSGCQVKVQFKVSTIDGKEIFSSYTRQEPISFQFGKRFDTPGLEEAISKMTKGGKAKVIVPSKMAFGEQGRGTVVAPYSTLLYEVEVIDVMSKAAYDKEQADKKKQDDAKKLSAKKDETGNLQKYLKEKKITAKPTASGLYFIEKVKGTGVQAGNGKKVTVHYTGTLLDGKKFDSSLDRGKPFEFTIGQGQVIKGWDEGISMMKKGGKATIIVPSSIGYGERDMGQIPPYSTLVFDVELLDVK